MYMGLGFMYSYTLPLYILYLFTVPKRDKSTLSMYLRLV